MSSEPPKGLSAARAMIEALQAQRALNDQQALAMSELLRRINRLDVAVAGVVRRVSEVEDRMRRLEAKVDALVRQEGWVN